MSVGGKPHVLGVTLRRSSARTAWGIRIVGGSDAGTPIIVTRVQDGSPAFSELRRGDIIKKIGDYDARDLRHEDAQNLFKSTGNSISLVIQRDPSSGMKPGIKPASVPVVPNKAPVAGGVPTPFASAALPVSNSTRPHAASPIPRHLSSPNPQRCASPVVFPPPLPISQEFPFPQQQQPGIKPHVQFRPLEPDEEQEEELANITNQPYRTTPLVLPGAKVKKDAVPTSSYLRHHPNPMFRQPPSHYDPTAEVLMKQKVADTVLQRVAGEEAASKQVMHKQFNSPIGLYSDQNIADTIQAQTGITPNNARVGTSTLNRRNQSKVSLRKTYSYDPAKSETFKALQEEELGDQVQEVTVPVQTRVFSPTAQAKKSSGPYIYQPQRAATGQSVNHTNSVGGQADDYIHQSGSFKRLMNQVLGESEF